MKIDFPFSRKTALKNRVLLNIRETAHDVGFFFFWSKNLVYALLFWKFHVFWSIDVKNTAHHLGGCKKIWKVRNSATVPLVTKRLRFLGIIQKWIPQTSAVGVFAIFSLFFHNNSLKMGMTLRQGWKMTKSALTGNPMLTSDFFFDFFSFCLL